MIENLKKSYFSAKKGNGKLPCYEANENERDIFRLIEFDKIQIENCLLKYGGILLRGFDIRAVSEFSKLANMFSTNLFDYVNRSTPRTRLGGKIYTATEYPSDKYIPFHNENSYTLEWPNKLMFFSVVVADEGGETAIADSRHVYSKIDLDIINKFNENKVLYSRNYYEGIDLSWQEVFQTKEKTEVEKYCKEHFISCEWGAGNLELTTKQICQATLKHPITGENVWFNQAHLFHISSLKEYDRQELINLLGSGALPRNAYYGDGSEIEDNSLNVIRQAYEQERIEFIWQKGDVMILDNRLMAHSRNPFKGNRKVVVAMGD